MTTVTFLGHTGYTGYLVQFEAVSLAQLLVCIYDLPSIAGL